MCAERNAFRDDPSRVRDVVKGIRRISTYASDRLGAREGRVAQGDLKPQGSVGMAVDYRDRNSLGVWTGGYDRIQCRNGALVNLQVVRDELALDHIGL